MSVFNNISHSQRQIFKGELNRIVGIGVPESCGQSELISGTFIILKKRWLSLLDQGLPISQQGLKQKVWPMPKISELLAKRAGYKFMSKINILMQYYTFKLDKERKQRPLHHCNSIWLILLDSLSHSGLVPSLATSLSHSDLVPSLATSSLE